MLTQNIIMLTQNTIVLIQNTIMLIQNTIMLTQNTVVLMKGKCQMDVNVAQNRFQAAGALTVPVPRNPTRAPRSSRYSYSTAILHG